MRIGRDDSLLIYFRAEEGLVQSEWVAPSTHHEDLELTKILILIPTRFSAIDCFLPAHTSSHFHQSFHPPTTRWAVYHRSSPAQLDSVLSLRGELLGPR